MAAHAARVVVGSVERWSHPLRLSLQRLGTCNKRERIRSISTPCTITVADRSIPASVSSVGRLASAVLDESDVFGVLTEALAADVDPVLADQAVLVSTDAAAARSCTVLLGMGVPHVLVRHGNETTYDLPRCVFSGGGCALTTGST